ncbi:putative Dihydrodipicolinate synthase family protein [Gammaproteobacteria bacterium]
MPKIITAIVTPRNNGMVDIASLASLIQFQMNSHVSALFLLGTTGEFNKMSLADKKALLDGFYKIKNNNKEPIFSVIGISAQKSAETLDIIEHCAKKKYDVDVFAVAPLFGEGDSEKKVSFILQHTTTPVMLYNNPAIHGGANIPVELVKKFTTHPQIIGIKDSSGNREYFNSLLLFASAKFHIYQGAEDNLINDLKHPKLTGLISGSANIIPLVFYSLVEGINIDFEQRQLLAIKRQLAKYSNYIQGMKEMLCNGGVLASSDTFD